jgi:type IX secretion system PorP/SprF family membrane protein
MAMKKTLLIVLFLLGFSIITIAQQDPMYSQYVFNGLIINPAYAGTRDVLCASILYRDQWESIPGAPKTGIFSIDAPIQNKNVGIGMTVEFDRIGISSHTAFNGIYSYRLRFDQSSLVFGLQAGVGFSSSNFSSVRYTDGTQNDIAFQNNFHDVLPNFGFGLYYFSNKFYAGFSIPQIAGYAIQNALYHKTESAYLDLANHYFINTGFLFDITSDIKAKPSLLLKYVRGAPVEMDLNGIVWFYDLIAAGVSYRSLASLDFILQFRATHQISIGYAYEYATTRLNSFSSGSHEIMLQYFFDFSHSKIVTPRFF